VGLGQRRGGREGADEQVLDAELREQRISFAYGNAPEESGITKESVREASRTLRMLIK
jgi:hypothetical protein